MKTLKEIPTYIFCWSTLPGQNHFLGLRSPDIFLPPLLLPDGNSRTPFQISPRIARQIVQSNERAHGTEPFFPDAAGDRFPP